MKRLSTILAIIAVICVYGCAEKHNNREYQRCKTELMRIRTKFKDYRSIADETGIDSLVTFFEDNGTEEDRFLANYYLGHYYFDNQNINHRNINERNNKFCFSRNNIFCSWYYL